MQLLACLRAIAPLLMVPFAVCRRGKLGATEELAPYDLAVKLIDEYIGYPLGGGLMPYNYCAAEAVVPDAVKPLIRAVC